MQTVADPEGFGVGASLIPSFLKITRFSLPEFFGDAMRISTSGQYLVKIKGHSFLAKILDPHSLFGTTLHEQWIVSFMYSCPHVDTIHLPLWFTSCIASEDGSQFPVRCIFFQ